jgi:Arc/MetJ-type ribon-helix-helix transcriptional regulator
MSETEKITINLGLVDLGQVDLLVQEGFYSNRTDFVRTAIRNQLMTYAEEVKQTVARVMLQPEHQRLARGRRDPGDKGSRAGEHRRGCQPRAGPRNHKLPDRARRPQGQPGRQVGAERPYPRFIKTGSRLT